jgi:replication factor C large subunit
MEKRKGEMRIEERDKRARELENMLMNVIPEVEEPPAEVETPETEEELPFEIPGIGSPQEEVAEEPENVEEEKVEEKKEKKKSDKQTTLFSF